MLFVAIGLMTVGYTMVYSVLHGHWEFWRYFFPNQSRASVASQFKGAALAPAAG